MEAKEITAFVGNDRPVKVLVIGPYYTQVNGIQVCQAFNKEDLVTGVHLDSISDADCFTWPEPIKTICMIS